MDHKAWLVALVLLMLLAACPKASPSLGMYFDLEATETHYVSLGITPIELITVYFFTQGIQELGGAKFKVAWVGCPPLIGESVNMPMGVVQGTPTEGLIVTFSPPLTNGPLGHIYLGSMGVIYHSDCFIDPSLELSLVAHPEEPTVLIYDSELEEWASALGNALGFSDGLPSVHATMGMVKRMYR